MTQMDDDRWRSCGSDWDEPGTGPQRSSAVPATAPNGRPSDADAGTRTAAPSATGSIGDRPDSGDHV
ncbi:hypothetical protein O7632_08225 [Solwaraspora sp. WMMD406]|uniref:hypothetical protein n=1 Tax=Solwaraspora sp. WMMD406 TaxID=3016095 RepID=UPI002417DE85|nr:hypothetical protein [Solwaraspora sp. WMMD406]MDG4764091.1 hypothetical protein [Solwaraspora sp. WMMD406]